MDDTLTKRSDYIANLNMYNIINVLPVVDIIKQIQANSIGNIYNRVSYLNNVNYILQESVEGWQGLSCGAPLQVIVQWAHNGDPTNRLAMCTGVDIDY